MNDSTWGGTPPADSPAEPSADPQSGHDPYGAYGAWPEQAAGVVATPYASNGQGAEGYPVHAQGTHGSDGHGRPESYGDDGATRAQQHRPAAVGVQTQDDHTQVLSPIAGHDLRDEPEPSPDPLFRQEPARADVARSGTGHKGLAVTDEPPAKRVGKAGRNLPQAIAVGAGLGAVIVASLLTLPVLFVGVVLIAVLVGLWELTGAFGKAEAVADASGRTPQGATVGRGIRLPFVPLAVGSVAMLVAGYARGAEGLAIATALTAVAVMVWRMTEGQEDFLRDMTAGVFTVFYLPFLAGFAVLMLADDQGAQRVLTFIILVVCADTGAYAAGVTSGGPHKMAPTISPGKSWEGFAGGVVTSAVAGALCVMLMLDGAWWQGAVVGVAAAAVSALGDLAESMIKRDLKVKDMGSLLPGHGGVMDRLDSLLAAAPVVWLLLAAFV
ncbi:phosphatidate cytidylyltransferase [Streptomyces sp. SID3343]|uniref:phosphatidate cytidylyltransferase n=1 Tax=Streptomyces sp. SID3343 TaxID=2690260 RepID=UPI001367B41A|nr:phosphatidate cytidylyltransferase [Streptomyces sp. SID3343]MYW00495.1 phosphatidate cytidylyltransferase [Streptomyces sp. SID3343]